MLSFGNTICVAQVAAQPKSSFPFYEKLITYISPMVAALTAASNKTYLTKLFSRPTALKLQILASLVKKYNVHAGFFRLHMKGDFLILISMTSLLTHNVAHSTRHYFRPKTNIQPIKKILSLAFS